MNESEEMQGQLLQGMFTTLRDELNRAIKDAVQGLGLDVHVVGRDHDCVDL